jgi:hypothetical protein
MLVVGLELEISKIPDLARRKLLLPGLLLSRPWCKSRFVARNS